MVLGYSLGLICIDFASKRISIIDLFLVVAIGSLIFIDSIIQTIIYKHLSVFVFMFLIAYVKSLIFRISTFSQQLKHYKHLDYSWKNFTADLSDVQSQFLLSLFYFIVVSPFALILIMSRIISEKKSNTIHSSTNDIDSMTYALMQG